MISRKKRSEITVVWPVLAAVAVLLAGLATSGCGVRQLARGELMPPEVQLKGLGLQPPTNQGLPLSVVLAVQNPNSRAITVLGYDWLSGLDRMWLSNDPLMVEGVVSRTHTSTVTWAFDERLVVWAQVADGVGNISEPYPAYAGDVGNAVYLPLVIKDG